MEFDKSRVYTALNADELKVGSKVIVADNIANLKERVAEYDEDRHATKIISIDDEHSQLRFETDGTGNYVGTHWELAYLVSEPSPLRCADLMVIGVDRSDNEVFLPRLEWVSDIDLTKYHKKVDE